MIQWTRVNELRDEVGAEDFDEVVDLFLEEVEEVMHRLRRDTGRDTLEQDLHFLKGSALSLGFADFSDLCRQGERQSLSGGADSVDVLEIIAGFERSKAAFIAGLRHRVPA